MEREWEAANGIVDDWDEEDLDRILLPYKNWKPGGWTSGNEPVSFFSLLDHYDEAQLPDNADPDYYEQFIIYIRDAPPATEGAK
ncbi:hypothetical protein RhiirC2_793942 [Rhizophagus irregularis]|uniref:Uncharacterized protein n=1 Tax=Rhizophagus irregularis TaxID=588596 RepID=A0A2N1MEI3_9GLOM|nr:hypothetical protein RhiirC2_793942 [Rhizophagus irregularis]